MLALEGLGRHWKKSDLLAAVGRLLSREAMPDDVAAHVGDGQFALLTATPSDESATQRAQVLGAALAALCEEMGARL